MKFKLNVGYIVTKSDSDIIFEGDTLMLDRSYKACRENGFGGYLWYNIFLPVRDIDKPWMGLSPQRHIIRYDTKELMLEALNGVEGVIDTALGQLYIDNLQLKINKLKKQYEII